MHAITRRGFNRATSRDARKWKGLEWDFHWFPIIQTDRIIGYRNALSDSISVSFGTESNMTYTTCIVVTQSIRAMTSRAESVTIIIHFTRAYCRATYSNVRGSPDYDAYIHISNWFRNPKATFTSIHRLIMMILKKKIRVRQLGREV